MITALRLKNFKCFQDVSIPLAPLTLLSGVNGAGKSSVLQALLLLRQSWSGVTSGEEAPVAPRLAHLLLNSDLVQIGTSRDAFCSYAEEQRIGFELTFSDGAHASWSFDYDEAATVLAATETSNASADTGGQLDRQARFSSSGIFGMDFQYLCAERIGPRTSFPISDYAVRHHRQLGVHGEFTTHFLTVYGDEKIRVSTLASQDAVAMNLRSQVEAWMDFICPGTRLTLTAHPGMDLVQLQYQFVAGRDVTDAYRPTNVGFGLTYTVPILVAILAARPGALLLIENPEAHLHPRGQARMGEFLALAASAGVQVLIETHSDHVLNGVRLAVHEGSLAPEKVCLHFFVREDMEDRPIHQVISPKIDRHGRIDRRPEGFFDEWDKSLRRLLTPTKNT